MKRIPSRVVIYTRDVENILGRHSRTACRILQRIRKYHNKSNKQPVTINEFCTFLKMDEEVVRRFMV